MKFRALASPARLAKSEDFLLPRVGGRFALFQTLRVALADFARRAGCTDTKPISPHRLRHTWASEMLRCGIGLPALKQLMGHKDIRMTLRYLQVTQPDLQREFYRARQSAAQPYRIPSLSVSAATADLPGIRQAIAATRHLLEMYRRQLSDEKLRRRLQRLDRRLLDVDRQLQNIAARRKMRKDWPVNRQRCTSPRAIRVIRCCGRAEPQVLRADSGEKRDVPLLDAKMG